MSIFWKNVNIIFAMLATWNQDVKTQLSMLTFHLNLYGHLYMAFKQEHQEMITSPKKRKHKVILANMLKWAVYRVN